MNNEEIELKIRAADAQDKKYIYDSWIKNYCQHGTDQCFNEEDRYFKYKYQAMLIDSILSKSQVDVYYSDDRPEVVIGWICYQWQDGQVIIHYIFINSYFRKDGIGKMMINTIRNKHAFFDKIIITHLTHHICWQGKKSILHKRYHQDFVYLPKYRF